MSNGQKTPPVKVELVNPPLENPWRTKEDYLNEQKRSKKLYAVAIVSIVVSALGVLATSVTATVTLRSYAKANQAQVVRVECVAPPASGPTEKMPEKSPR